MDLQLTAAEAALIIALRKAGITIGATSVPCATDLLYGVAAIAEHLGITERQAVNRVATKSIPTFKMDGSRIVCATRSGLDAWMRDQQRQGGQHHG